MATLSVGGTTVFDGATLQSGAVLTSATFPAGHVVQTTAVTRGTTRTNVNQQSGYISTVVASTLTPKYDNSAIIAFMNYDVHWSGESSGDMGYALRVHKSGTGVSTTYPLGMYTSYGNSSQYHNAYYQNGSGINQEANRYETLILQDEDCETTNPITYTLQAAQYSIDSVFYFGNNTWNNYQWSVYFMEIKR